MAASNGRPDRPPSDLPSTGARSGTPGSARTSDVDAFLQKVAATPAPVRAADGSSGRLIFSMDATASREPTWDRACRLQGEMFQATKGLGGLQVQLVFYRGFGECKASPWVTDSDALLRRMTSVMCLGGQTQINRILRHAVKEADKHKVNALVFVGDAFEEDIDRVCDTAGALGLRGVPAFVFHEGSDPVAGRAFEQIARLTNGAYCRFDSSSADQLKALMGAVAAYAAGGHRALTDYSQRHRSDDLLRLTDQMARGR